MPSERVQRRIDRLLDQAEEAADRRDWDVVLECVGGVLQVDNDNEDALQLRKIAEGAVAAGSTPAPVVATVASVRRAQPPTSDQAQPYSFASGRYTVSKFLGEGGKKKVYLAHDNTLDRDVAFALIKTEGLDETSRERVKREAQAMGRMGTHPCIMPIYDLGEESGQPYMVQPLMDGGDVEGLVQEADGPLELDRAITIATQTALGLSFAHSKGVIHRDLKPGNVWLDEDGAAKIGDFGLAVATDRSRLTVEKVMVGTVSYMPPEQATGGDVTPQADLYSLGAMLYEMCTGRVPFMGDDDIGVISQHINTPPVAPSWHNAQIPKTLDSLILRLLAKDPSERPSDADEVLAALQAVDLTAVEERDEESKGSLDAMAGGVFVGRHREMDQLKSIFEDVLSGKGRMVTLVGEPGIGKTRTAQELATYAGMRGAEVLWGRSYESGGAPPYWPWVQAIRAHVAATEPQELRNQLGSTAPVIAELVSDVKAKLPDVPAPTPIEDPESARFRLFDSISTFLKNVSVNQPLVLMLEDLHWSDKPSLMLLEFVARELANSRILIVGNYRDMELNRRHPLSVTLGDLTRERLFERVVLRGLQKHDVHRFIEIAAGITPPAALVDTVYSQTEGNPLFVTETVRLLIQEGDISSGQSSKGGTTSWEIRIPEGVREVIGRRLDRLSERCNEVLTIAAVNGRQFRFDVLKMLAEDTTDSQLLDAMDEALNARIIEELPDEIGLYQFTHAQMQETMVSELSSNRLVRMHARIAEALENYYGNRAEENAAELVEHFAEAEVVLGTEKLIKYRMAAGGSAQQALAYDSALHHYLQVLKVDDGELTSVVKATALGGAGYCHYANYDVDLAASVLEQAFKLFVSLGRNESAIAISNYPVPAFLSPKYKNMFETALSICTSGSEDEALILTRYGVILANLGENSDVVHAQFDKALQIAMAHGNDTLVGWTYGRLATAEYHGGEYSRSYKTSAHALERAHATEDWDLLVHSISWNIHGACTLGTLNVAEASEEELLRAGKSARTPMREIQANTVALKLASIRGDWARFTQLVESSQVAESSLSKILSLWNRLQQGLEVEIQRELKISSEVWGDHTLFLLMPVALHSWQSGDTELALNVTATLESIKRVMLTGPQYFRDYYSFVNGVVALAASDRLRAQEAYDRIVQLQVRFLPFISSPILSLHRICGALAAFIGMPDKADEHYSAAYSDCRAGYFPELAWTCSDYSNLLLERNAPGDREKAIELQDEAIAITTKLGMKPLLERVLSKRNILRA